MSVARRISRQRITVKGEVARANEVKRLQRIGAIDIKVKTRKLSRRQQKGHNICQSNTG
jgi:hypothetical protein